MWYNYFYNRVTTTNSIKFFYNSKNISGDCPICSSTWDNNISSIELSLKDKEKLLSHERHQVYNNRIYPHLCNHLIF